MKARQELIQAGLIEIDSRPPLPCKYFVLPPKADTDTTDRPPMQERPAGQAASDMANHPQKQERPPHETALQKITRPGVSLGAIINQYQEISKEAKLSQTARHIFFQFITAADAASWEMPLLLDGAAIQKRLNIGGRNYETALQELEKAGVLILDKGSESGCYVSTSLGRKGTIKKATPGKRDPAP